MEKKYLKWYNKIGYGTGDIGVNIINCTVTTFMLLYLTDVAGLNAGICGVLMMVARIADGVTDVIFGYLIDRTKTKMGKARPWMLWSYIGNAVCLLMLFAIPKSMGDTAKYVYFFITYTMLNAVFYTATSIAFTTISALVTKNNGERVQLSVSRYVFSVLSSVFVTAATVGLVNKLGGGAVGWRSVAIIYMIVGIVFNLVSVFSVRELPDGEDETEKKADTKMSIFQGVKILFTNKYYLLILGMYLATNIVSGLGGASAHYMTYVLGDASLLGAFSAVGSVPAIVGLLITPFLIKKFGSMQKASLIMMVLGVVSRVLMIVFGYMKIVPAMIAASGIAAFFIAPLAGSFVAMTGTTADYIAIKKGVRIDGMTYSCSSVGIKVGTGIGTALCGILLDIGNYIPNAAVQPDSCIAMLNFIYLWFPAIIYLVITLMVAAFDVEHKVIAARND